LTEKETFIEKIQIC